MNILGIFSYSRDPSACLIIDGELIAMAEEERFTRIKHAENQFPKNAIKFCLEKGRIKMSNLDYISMGWDVDKYPEKIANHFKMTSELLPAKDNKTIEWELNQVEKFKREVYEKKIIGGLLDCGYTREEIPSIVFKGHHYCHAVSAYLASGFKDASIITADGHGELNCTVLWEVKDGQFRKIKEINIPHSLGWFYAAFTRFTGFKIYSGEGKTMGLAPYGKPRKIFRDAVCEMLKLSEGSYEVDPTYLFHQKRTIANEFSDKFADIFGEYRINDKAEIKENHEDAAYEAQRRLEEVGLHLAEYLIDRTGIPNLCLAGGVALNCKMNGYIHRSNKVENIFIQPVSGDDGTSLGAAMAVYLEKFLDTSKFKMEHVYLGPSYSDVKIREALDSKGLTYKKVDNIEELVAKLLAEGKIIGWFQGRMEVGPRALGSRSILADPRDASMKDIVNAKVKFREGWRPFCPSILSEYIEDYLIKPCYHPFMILTFKIKEDKIGLIPSVVHIDGTARPQVVKKEVNERYWNLINEFRKLTDVPVLLNTSFNVKGEPIVCTPEDGVNCYLKTGIDVLAIGDYLITHKT